METEDKKSKLLNRLIFDSSIPMPLRVRATGYHRDFLRSLDDERKVWKTRIKTN